MKKYWGLIILTLLLIKIGDVFLVHKYREGFLQREQFFFDLDFIYLPYTGFHIGQYKRFEKTSSHLLDLDGLDIRTGDHGYFIDFPLDRPPVKKPGEYRLILTGASVAQGFGARTNDEMFYRRLEMTVNEKLKAMGSSKTLRVINLAMIASNTFQNYIALNLFAHKLEADAIATVSGVIDDELESGMFHGGFQVGGFVYSQHLSRNFGVMRALETTLPGIMKYSAIGQALRSMNLYESIEQYRSDYDQMQPEKDQLKRAISFYSHSLSSIMRDFPETPLLLITQPTADKTDEDAFYQECFGLLAAEMKKGQLRVIDASDYWKKNSGFPGSFYDSRHLSSKGSEVLGSFVAEPVIKLVLAQKSGSK